MTIHATIIVGEDSVVYKLNSTPGQPSRRRRRDPERHGQHQREVLGAGGERQGRHRDRGGVRRLHPGVPGRAEVPLRLAEGHVGQAGDAQG